MEKAEQCTKWRWIGPYFRHNFGPLKSLNSGLQSFSLFSDRRASKSALSSLELSTLSRNLKHLDLDCNSSLEALNLLHLTNPGHFQRLERLTVKFGTSPLDVKFEMLPTTLTHLQLSRIPSSNICTIPSSLLPQSLNSIALLGVEMNLDAPFPSKNLKSFSCSAHFGSSDGNNSRWPLIFQFLPIGIEKIDIKSTWGGLAGRTGLS